MYEHFKTEFLSQLSNFNSQTINLISIALDQVAQNYDIKEKETALVVREEVIPKQVKMYLATLKIEGKSERTIILYQNRLRIFFETVRKPIEDITGNDIRLFLVEFQNERGVGDETLDHVRSILSSFFNWCVAEDYLLKSPCLNVKKIKFEPKKREALTRFQLEQLRHCCKNERERAIVETLYSTGVRVDELCRMRKSEINTTDKSIVVVGKGKVSNTVYFNEASQYALENYMKVRKDDSDWLFYAPRTKSHMSEDYIEKIFRQFSKRVGFYVCPHMMRHTFATLSLQAGMPIDVVQKALAHASVSTTQRYAKTQQTDVQNAHKKYVV